MAIQHPSDPGLFSISADLGARLLRFKITKLWDMETFDLYRQALLIEIRRFAGRPFDMIGDLTKSPTQPQFLNEARQEINKTAQKMGLRKCAIIVTGALVKHQIRRLSDESHQFFTSEKDALAWIRE